MSGSGYFFAGMMKKTVKDHRANPINRQPWTIKEATVAKVTDSSFSVSLIPHTGEETTLLSKKVGDPVNLENDIVGKYVERFLTFEKPAETSCQSVDLAFLAEHGFA